MIKKIVSVLVIAMLLSASALAAYIDVPDDAVYKQAVERLSALGILSGTGDGTFSPDAYVTRAQFAKMVVCALGEKDNINFYSKASIFTDIPSGYWATGYINYVSQKGIINGYPDGTFAPEENVTYAQALTVIVRMLGYTAEDVGYHWPSNYIDKARALELTEGFDFGEYYYVTRGITALLFDRALFTETKGSSEGQAGKLLIESLDIKVYDDCIVCAVHKSDPSLASNEVRTSAGVFKKTDSSIDALVGRRAKVLVNKDNEIVSVIEKPQKIKSITIRSYYDKNVVFDENGQTKSFELDDNMVVYYKGQKQSVSALTSKLTEGNELVLYSDEDAESFDYAFLYEFEMAGPFTITTEASQLDSFISGLTAKNPKVIRNGYASSINEISQFDVVYYAEKTNTVYVYTDKVTGIYEKALPLKANVTSVVVSGATYSISTPVAASKLNESAGAFKIGDKVTLLLGKDGTVVDAVSLSQGYAGNYGVVLGTREEASTDGETKGQLQYIAKIFVADGTTMEYKTDKNYKEYKTKLVQIDFSGGRAVLSLPTTTLIEGEINKPLNKIGNYWLAKDCKILDIIYKPEPGNDDEAIVKLVTLNDLTVKSISKKQVINTIYANKMKDISILYLDNLSKSGYEYGYVTDIIKGRASNTYVINIKGVDKEFVHPGLSIRKDTVVGIRVSGGKIYQVMEIPKVGSGDSLDGYNDEKIMVDGIAYPLASDFQVYKLVNYKYVAASLSDIESMERIANIDLFADDKLDNGGQIRVILVR